MGAVYLAEHVELRSRVALKFLHRHLVLSVEAEERFAQEARVVGAVGHPNIVAVLDVGTTDGGRPWFAMEYLDGVSLERALQEGPMSVARMLAIVGQIGAALQQAHLRGVVHRDLKPANVMLLRLGRQDDFVKVLDFGVAKVVGGARRLPTSPGHPVGTPEYMAPEQVLGAEVDARADLYALGIIAWELLVGRTPWAGRPVGAVLRAHLQEEPPPPHLFNEAVPPSLSLVVLKALARAPEDRFPSVSAWLDALRLAAPVLDSGLATPSPVASPLRPAVAARPGQLSLDEGGVLDVSCHAVSRVGCFAATRAELPLFAAGVLELPPLGTLAVQVVRRVGAADAHRWHRHEGYFLEFASPDARQRVLLDGLGGERADLEAEERLEAMRSWLWGDAYAVLGLLPDASVGEVLVALGRRFEHLDELSRRELSPRQARELHAARQRVKNAGALLTVLPHRLDFDATHGNWRGVGACLRAGLSLETLEGQHREFLRKYPAAGERAHALLVRARKALADGAPTASVELLEQALAATPLWGALHQLREEVASSEVTK